MYSKNAMTILVVEGNSTDATIIRNFLGESAQRTDVFFAETLFEALVIASEKKIDLVLLNLELPDSSGFRTLTRYMEAVPHLPVIVLSSINNEIIGSQAIRAGAQDFLVKGQFDAKILGRAVRNAIQRFATLQKIQRTCTRLSIREKKFEEAQRMARLGNWEMDPVSNEMLWSDEIFQIFGLQSDSVLPSWSEYIALTHPEDRAYVHEFFDRVMKDGRLLQMEHRILTRGRVQKLVSVHAKVMYEETTEKVQIVGVLQDISERKYSENKLLSPINVGDSDVKWLSQWSQMAFRLRKPMGSIVHALLLTDNNVLSPKQKAFFDGLGESAADLVQQVQGLLNLSEIAIGQQQTVETAFRLTDLVLEVQDLLQIEAERKKQLVKFATPDLTTAIIIGDAQKISLLLYNLTTFSLLKFGSEGLVTANLHLTEREFKPFLRISVECSGSGVVPTQLREYLEPGLKNLDFSFENGADAGKTSMAYANRLSAALGGRLEILGTEGSGYTFSVEFPVKMGKKLQSSEAGLPSEALKVLLVEDHFLNRMSMKKTLCSWSDFVAVDFAENGLEAVQMLKKENYNIVLMDTQMPIMDGIEATALIRSFSSVPIIALSAAASKQEEERCFAAGCNAYLAKPFKSSDLFAKMAIAMDKPESADGNGN